MRIFLECTRTVSNGLHSGIQRVVRRYFQELSSLVREQSGVSLIPVFFKEGTWLRLSHLPPNPLEALPENTGRYFTETLVDVELPHSGDILLLMDAGWYVEGLLSELAQSKARGCRLIYLCHDVLPIQQPQLFPEQTNELFHYYWDFAVREAERIICVSGTTRRQFEMLRGSSAKDLVLDLSANHLGGNFYGNSCPDKATRLADIFVKSRVFICVGTIEIRKRHQMLLEVFERLWGDIAADDVKLVFVGRLGWHADGLWERLIEHPERNKRLFVFEDMTDAELCYAYRHSYALVSASQDEGFGLPVAEALYYGLSVLVSDIAVYRELLQGKQAVFFDGADGLYEALKDSLKAEFVRQQQGEQGWISWRTSAKRLLGQILARPGN